MTGERPTPSIHLAAVSANEITRSPTAWSRASCALRRAKRLGRTASRPLYRADARNGKAPAVQNQPAQPNSRRAPAVRASTPLGTHCVDA